MKFKQEISKLIEFFPLFSEIIVLIGRDIIFLKTGDVFDENSGKEQLNELRALYERVAVPFLICQLNAQSPPI